MPAPKRRGLRAVVSVSLPPDVARLVERAAALRHERPSVFLRAAAVCEANRMLGIEPSAPSESKEAATVAA